MIIEKLQTQRRKIVRNVFECKCQTTCLSMDQRDGGVLFSYNKRPRDWQPRARQLLKGFIRIPGFLILLLHLPYCVASVLMFTAWLLHLKASYLAIRGALLVIPFYISLVRTRVTWLSLVTRKSAKGNIFIWAHCHPGQNGIC